MRYTEYHDGKAVIKDRTLLPGAMEKLAKIEDMDQICDRCKLAGLFDLLMDNEKKF